jgi:enoyl-CoA hydratase
MNKAQEYAEKICKAAPLAVRAAKEAVNRGCEMSLEDGLRLEYALNSYLTYTQDHAEGQKAFVEKRKPDYKGI